MRHFLDVFCMWISFASSIPRHRRFPFTLLLDRDVDVSYSSHQDTYSHETLPTRHGRSHILDSQLDEATEYVETLRGSGGWDLISEASLSVIEDTDLRDEELEYSLASHV